MSMLSLTYQGRKKRLKENDTEGLRHMCRVAATTKHHEEAISQGRISHRRLLVIILSLNC
jgi:hypothetical protein